MKGPLFAVLLFVLAAGVLVYRLTPPEWWPGSTPTATAGDAAADALQSARVDALFERWDTSDSPGCSVAVHRAGINVHERAYGMANLELAAAMTPESVLPTGAIAKQFTAMAVLLLAQQNQLSLDDPVRTHLAELPDYGAPLTIRHLLTQTDGLRDAHQLRALAPPTTVPLTNDAVVALLAKQRALNFVPGAEFSDSDGGYVLLATIVSRVTGQSLRTLTESAIFAPLGMAATRVHDDPELVVPRRATGYATRGTEMQAVPPGALGRAVGAAGLFTTAADLLRWERNFDEVRVGDPTLVAAMQAPTTLTGGSTSPFGFGIQTGRHRGLRTLGRSGSEPGYAAHVVRFPDQGVAVAVLCNLEDLAPTVGDLARRTAEIYIDALNAAGPATAPPASPALSADEMNARAGLYRDSAGERFMRLVVRDGALVAIDGGGASGGTPLTVVNTVQFTGPDGTVQIDAPPPGPDQTAELRVSGVGPAPIVLQKVPPFTPTPRDFRTVVGTYSNQEIDATYTVVARDAGVALHLPGRGETPLLPLMQDTYAAPIVRVVKFVRNADGLVIGLSVHADGVRTLRFDRVRR